MIRLDWIRSLVEIRPFCPFELRGPGIDCRIEDPDDVDFDGDALIIKWRGRNKAGDYFWAVNPAAISVIQVEGAGWDEFVDRREAAQQAYYDKIEKMKAEGKHPFQRLLPQREE